jgi:hypothetical protein
MTSYQMFTTFQDTYKQPNKYYLLVQSESLQTLNVVGRGGGEVRGSHLGMKK